MQFPISAFWPIAIGFFGLGVNYFVQGGSGLFGGPKATDDPRKYEKVLGMWGIFLGGFAQFITGTYLMVGLSWFPVYRNAAPLYMAALAFTAYGIHWFVIGWRKYIGGDAGPEAWMAIPFLIISILGAVSFGGNGDVPAMLLFIGLTLIYICEIFEKFLLSSAWGKGTAFFQLITGIWLMYLAIGVTLNLANGMHWWV